MTTLPLHLVRWWAVAVGIPAFGAALAYVWPVAPIDAAELLAAKLPVILGTPAEAQAAAALIADDFASRPLTPPELPPRKGQRKAVAQ